MRHLLYVKRPLHCLFLGSVFYSTAASRIVNLDKTFRELLIVHISCLFPVFPYLFSFFCLCTFVHAVHLCGKRPGAYWLSNASFSSSIRSVFGLGGPGKWLLLVLLHFRQFYLLGYCVMFTPSVGGSWRQLEWYHRWGENCTSHQ